MVNPTLFRFDLEFDQHQVDLIMNRLFNCTYCILSRVRMI